MLFHKKGFFTKAFILLLFCQSTMWKAFSQPFITNKKAPIIAMPPFRTSKEVLSAPMESSIFGISNTFIENIGQYGDTLPDYSHLGTIYYGYEGLGWPVLFTSKGLIYRQRKLIKRSHEELEEAERKGELEGEIEKGVDYTDRIVSMEWLGANPSPLIVAEAPTTNYYTYGQLTNKAKGFKRLVYKELYPGIDLVYTFVKDKTWGFTYSLVVHPGAQLSKVRLRWGGDVKNIGLNEYYELEIFSDIASIKQSAPISFYKDPAITLPVALAKPPDNGIIKSGFAVDGKDVRFVLPEGYNGNNTLIIDPFVTATTNLTGVSAGIAKDIDFDYAGNIYVTGGGSSTSAHQLAKFDKDGKLLWTFNGILNTPIWSFGANYGGWVVEKSTGKIYLGQGGTLFRVIRLNTDGVYDNYITNQDGTFQENWKMYWNCDGGVPKIMIAGGGSLDENINLGLFAPPSLTLSPLNITGKPTGHQDMADMLIDPKTNELYTIFAQGFIPTITENNRMYKHKPPYTASDMSWNRLSGYSVLNERGNRPYLGAGLNDNSINALAVNSNYLFYYDGRNLMALNKANGSNIGAAISIGTHTPLLQGGIVADECNNVFVGSTNGVIKVYKFTGSAFDDSAAPDISITGQSNASVYDLAYDNGKRLLYACGKGFVGSFDITSYCTTRIYSLALLRDCEQGSIIAALTPTLQSGSTVTYVLYQGGAELASNGTGVFNGLDKNTQYTVKALVDKDCGGPQALRVFSLADCTTGDEPEDEPLEIGAPGIYVPTAFTPDGDGNNDILKVIVRGLKEFKHFTLYNRWGEQIFTTKDPKKGWNGMIDGKQQATGVFVWMVEATGTDDKVIKLRGTTMLIR
jgi:gliding motility-associated-like protein